MNAIVEQNEQAPTSRSAMMVALEKRGLSEMQWRALVGSVFPGARTESILMAVDYCLARGLDVMKKPCHIVPMNVTNAKTGQKEWRDVVMPGIFELRVTAARTGQYAGMDEPEFGPEIEYLGVIAPQWCKVTVYRLVGSDRCDFSHVERFTECVGTTNDRRSGEVRVNAMWTKRPYGQIAKVAEAGALRKAFPEEIGGQYAAEELQGQEPTHINVQSQRRIESKGVAALEQAISAREEPDPAPDGAHAPTQEPDDDAAAIEQDSHRGQDDDDLPV